MDPATHVTLLTDKIAPESAKLALGVLGNYLLVARSPADLYALGPYVVRTVARAPAPKEDVALESRRRRSPAPCSTRCARCAARATTRPQRSSRSRRCSTRLPVFADSARARLVLSFEATVVRGRVTVMPKPGAGPASKVAADLAVGDVKPLLDLPEGTSLALLWRESAAARVENAGKQAEALAGCSAAT